MVSQGAKSDLELATNMAKSMVKEVGMGDHLMVVTGNDQMDSKDLAHEVNALLDLQYQRTVTLLRDNIDKLHVLALALLEKETLYSDELYALM